MTDTTDKSDLAKVVILSGWALTISVCLSIIGSAVYLIVIGHDIPAPLKEWAGMCLGFLLGSFVSLVKDYIKV